MEKTLHIDYITFIEGEQVVSYAPLLDLCFNAPEKNQSVDSLKGGTKMLIEVWKEKKVLNEKIETLGLNGTVTQPQKDKIQQNFTIPFYALKQGCQTDEFSLNVEVDA